MDAYLIRSICGRHGRRSWCRIFNNLSAMKLKALEELDYSVDFFDQLVFHQEKGFKINKKETKKLFLLALQTSNEYFNIYLIVWAHQKNKIYRNSG